MPILLRTLISLTLVGASASAIAANPAEALAQKSGCLVCHSIDKKILGPSFKDVATKYKGDKAAQGNLIQKVKVGGSGAWGSMPMPANSPQVKDADIKTIVQWVLSL